MNVYVVFMYERVCCIYVLMCALYLCMNVCIVFMYECWTCKYPLNLLRQPIINKNAT